MQIRQTSHSLDLSIARCVASASASIEIDKRWGGDTPRLTHDESALSRYDKLTYVHVAPAMKLLAAINELQSAVDRPRESLDIAIGCSRKSKFSFRLVVNGKEDDRTAIK